MTVFVVQHRITDSETMRVFRTRDQAESYVLTQARQLRDYDRTREATARNGAIEYACAKLGASITKTRLLE